MEFDWDAGNVEKLAWHDVEPEEAVEVFRNSHIKGRGPYREGGETRWDIIGRTVATPARILRVVYT